MSKHNGHHDHAALMMMTPEDFSDAMEKLATTTLFVTLCVERLGLSTVEQIVRQSVYEDGGEIPSDMVEQALGFYMHMVPHMEKDGLLPPKRTTP